MKRGRRAQPHRVTAWASERQGGMWPRGHISDTGWTSFQKSQGRLTAQPDTLLSSCSAAGQTPHARTGLRQPPETALGNPEALRSPGLVTLAPNTLSLIGYYSFFMKPSRLLPSSLGKTFAASFCNYISLVFVMAQK